MVEMQLEYLGDLRCRAVHGPSGVTITTDAPKDNHGKGESFSPSDLVATALGACMMTIMGIVARQHAIDITGTKVTVKKEMVAQPVRRIAKLSVDFHFPMVPSLEDQQRLVNAAHTCPVHKSLHPDVQTPIAFHWGK